MGLMAEHTSPVADAVVVVGLVLCAASVYILYDSLRKWLKDETFTKRELGLHTENPVQWLDKVDTAGGVAGGPGPEIPAALRQLRKKKVGKMLFADTDEVHSGTAAWKWNNAHYDVVTKMVQTQRRLDKEATYYGHEDVAPLMAELHHRTPDTRNVGGANMGFDPGDAHEMLELNPERRFAARVFHPNPPVEAVWSHGRVAMATGVGDAAAGATHHDDGDEQPVKRVLAEKATVLRDKASSKTYDEAMAMARNEHMRDKREYKSRSTTKLIFGYDDDDDEEAESDDDNVSERVVLEGALNDLGSLEKRPLAPTLRVDGTHIPPYVYKKVYCDSADLMHLVEVCALPANKDGAKTLHELVIHNIDFTDPVCRELLFGEAEPRKVNGKPFRKENGEIQYNGGDPMVVDGEEVTLAQNIFKTFPGLRYLDMRHNRFRSEDVVKLVRWACALPELGFPDGPNSKAPGADTVEKTLGFPNLAVLRLGHSVLVGGKQPLNDMFAIERRVQIFGKGTASELKKAHARWVDRVLFRMCKLSHLRYLSLDHVNTGDGADTEPLPMASNLDGFPPLLQTLLLSKPANSESEFSHKVDRQLNVTTDDETVGGKLEEFWKELGYSHCTDSLPEELEKCYIVRLKNPIEDDGFEALLNDPYKELHLKRIGAYLENFALAKDTMEFLMDTICTSGTPTDDETCGIYHAPFDQLFSGALAFALLKSANRLGGELLAKPLSVKIFKQCMTTQVQFWYPSDGVYKPDELEQDRSKTSTAKPYLYYDSFGSPAVEATVGQTDPVQLQTRLMEHQLPWMGERTPLDNSNSTMNFQDQSVQQLRDDSTWPIPVGAKKSDVRAEGIRFRHFYHRVAEARSRPDLWAISKYFVSPGRSTDMDGQQMEYKTKAYSIRYDGTFRHIFDEIVKLRCHEFFEGETVRVVINHNWRKVHTIFWCLALCYGFEVALATRLAVTFTDWRLPPPNVIDWFTLYALCLINVFRGMSEMVDFYQSKFGSEKTDTRYYWKNIWSWFDWFKVIFVGGSTFWYLLDYHSLAEQGLGYDQDDTKRIMFAMGLAAYWIGVWYYLIPFESMGKDVLMAVRIFTDTLPFYVVLMVCILALATPLHLLSPEAPHSNMDVCFKGQTGGCSEYSTMSKSLYSTMMMTVFAATDMEMFNSWENSLSAKMMTTVGILVIGLVIVNNLIALMTQSYEKLYPEIDNAMLMQKAIMMRKITWLNDTRHWVMRNNTRQRRYLKEKKRLVYFIADDAGGTIESAAQWRGIVFSLKKEMAKRDPTQDVEELKTEVSDVRNDLKKIQKVVTKALHRK